MKTRIDQVRLKSLLQSDSLVREVILLDEIDSTNRFTMDLARAGGREGVLVVAESQTAGRGRLGRIWQGNPFENLAFSLLLKPMTSPERGGLLQLTAGLAVAEALAGYVNRQPVCKWPNDILVDGKKVCGILAESIITSSSLESVVLGIGVNVHQHTFGDDLRRSAASLSHYTERTLDRTNILASIVNRLHFRYADFLAHRDEELVAGWKQNSRMLGRDITLDDGHTVRRVQVVDIMHDGRLIVAEGDQQFTVSAGDVTLHSMEST